MGSQSRIEQGLTPYLEDEDRLQIIARIFAPYLEQQEDGGANPTEIRRATEPR